MTSDVKELKKYYRQVKKAARRFGLKIFNDPIFYLVEPNQMTATAAFSGTAERYSYWAFGKLAEQIDINRNEPGATFLETVLASKDGTRAFLLKDLSLPQNLIIMAHVLAHCDFASQNQIMRQSYEKPIWHYVRMHAKRVRELAQNPAIGPQKVRETLEAARAIVYQCSHGAYWGNQTDDLLETTLAKSTILEDWQKELLKIVHEEWLYFLPVLETKICNEGWATFWQMKILAEIGLPGALWEECLQTHLAMLNFPPGGNVNPYLLGYKMFEDIAKEKGMNEIFEARRTMHDIPFVEKYLTQAVAQECGLFSWGPKAGDAKSAEYLEVKNVADEHDWEKVKKVLLENIGCAVFPPVKVSCESFGGKPRLIIKTSSKRKVLEADWAHKTMVYLYSLWGIPIEIYHLQTEQRRLIEFLYNGISFTTRSENLGGQPQRDLWQYQSFL